MTYRCLLVLVVGVVGLSSRLETPVDAQAARSWSVPRTPWGHPDLQGTYSNDDETGTPMERPKDDKSHRVTISTANNG